MGEYLLKVYKGNTLYYRGPGNYFLGNDQNWHYAPKAWEGALSAKGYTIDLIGDSSFDEAISEEGTNHG